LPRRLPGEGQDPFAAPASAGVTGFLVSALAALARRRLVNHVNGSEH
jgi:hypothetical protein